MKKNQYIDLAKYEILDKIGKGSFAEVFKIRNNQTQQLFAAKVSNQYVNEDPKLTTRDQNIEIKILSKLNHPSIVKFYGYSPLNFKKEDKPVIVTEYLVNNSLKKLLDNEKKGNSPKEWNDTKKLIIIYGIASGMEYLHKQNIVHRDLKPDNILLDHYLYPKICDFGLSKELVNSVSSSNNYKGTFLYMAPEIFVSLNYSEYSDVYAFALVTYEIITNEELFPNLSIYNFMDEVVKGTRPKFNSKINPSIKRLILDCWQKDPLKRPKFSTILQRLKNDRGFVKGIENEQEFTNFMKYVDDKANKPLPEPSSVNLYQAAASAPSHSSYHYLYDEEEEEEEGEVEDKADENHDEIVNYDELICPKDVFDKLSKNNKSNVIRAINDRYYQYTVGSNFIKSRNDFPLNRDLGIKYLQKSIENGNDESSALYGETISNEEEIDQANEFIQSSKPSVTISVLRAMILLKQKKYNEANLLFLDLINKGSYVSARQMAKIYREGIGVPKDAKMADKYTKKARQKKRKQRRKRMKQTDPEELYKIAMNIKETTSNICGAISYFKAASRKGHVKSMKELIQIYYEGIQSTQFSYKKALQYAKMAADKGDIESMRKAASMYEDGEGSKQDLKMAVYYYKKAALVGDPYSINKYALMLDKGDGIDPDKKLACQYYKLAADADNEFAIYNYAMMLLKGEGVEADADEAIKYLQKGVALGNIKAKEALQKVSIRQLKDRIKKGDINALFEYAEFLFFVKKKPELALKYYSIAAKEGNSEAKKALKNLRKNQPGLFDNDDEFDDKKSSSSNPTRENADSDDVEAMMNYANEMNERSLAFHKAIKLNQEPEITEEECISAKREALKYYKKAANKGNGDAMVHCGIYYEYGYGIKENQPKAFDYYTQASDNNFADGTFHCGLCFEFGHGVDMNLEKAVKYYRKAAGQNHVKAMARLAKCLEKGKGCKKNEKEALKWFEKVADSNERLKNHYEELREKLRSDDDSNEEEEDEYQKDDDDDDDF